MTHGLSGRDRTIHRAPDHGLRRLPGLRRGRVRHAAHPLRDLPAHAPRQPLQLLAEGRHDGAHRLMGDLRQHGPCLTDAGLPPGLVPAQGRETEGAAGHHTGAHGQQAVGGAIDDGGGALLQHGAHQRHTGGGQGRSHGGQKLAHALGDGLGDVQRIDGKRDEGGRRDRAVDAPQLGRAGPLVVDGRDPPDHARQGKEDDERVQTAVLGQGRAQKDPPGILADGLSGPGIQHIEGPWQKVGLRAAETGGHDMGIPAQATGQFPGKSLALGFAGIVTQHQPGPAREPGQSQPAQGPHFQGQQEGEGQPAPAGGQDLHGTEGREIQLEQQYEDHEHEYGRGCFEKSREDAHDGPRQKGKVWSAAPEKDTGSAGTGGQRSSGRNSTARSPDRTRDASGKGHGTALPHGGRDGGEAPGPQAQAAGRPGGRSRASPPFPAGPCCRIAGGRQGERPEGPADAGPARRIACHRRAYWSARQTMATLPRHRADPTAPRPGTGEDSPGKHGPRAADKKRTAGSPAVLWFTSRCGYGPPGPEWYWRRPGNDCSASAGRAGAPGAARPSSRAGPDSWPGSPRHRAR